MKNKSGLILNLILIVFILLTLVFGVYYLYLNTPGDPENLSPSIPETSINREDWISGEVPQFYPNMKFNHNSISYEIDSYCSIEKRQRMISAFNDLASRVKIISFHEVMDNPDIEISCSENEKESVNKNYFIAGEGGAKEIVQTKRYNIITNGTVLLYKEANSQDCDWANVELHELIHVFGFGHSEDKNSLMYPYLESCDQELDESIINTLKKLYSEENLADLYFDKISAVKKGRYLDFNLSIENSGSISSEKAQFSVLEDNELVEDFDLEPINYGAGIVIEIKYLKLISRNPEEIRFVIDRKNMITEIDEKNNIAVVSLVSAN